MPHFHNTAVAIDTLASVLLHFLRLVYVNRKTQRSTYHLLLTWKIQLLAGLAQYFPSWHKTLFSIKKALDAAPYDFDGIFLTKQGASTWLLQWSREQCFTEYASCAHLGGVQNNADEDFNKI